MSRPTMYCRRRRLSCESWGAPASSRAQEAGPQYLASPVGFSVCQEPSPFPAHARMSMLAPKSTTENSSELRLGEPSSSSAQWTSRFRALTSRWRAISPFSLPKVGASCSSIRRATPTAVRKEPQWAATAGPLQAQPRLCQGLSAWAFRPARASSHSPSGRPRRRVMATRQRKAPPGTEGPRGQTWWLRTSGAATFPAAVSLFITWTSKRARWRVASGRMPWPRPHLISLTATLSSSISPSWGGGRQPVAVAGCADQTLA
mmetsp:Transcript_28381/g.62568  ORF Transcript_28381/g.62568 Transcript_28381/m.62568 type:complete len:260 (-) Transcript_28381:127-906(-)